MTRVRVVAVLSVFFGVLVNASETANGSLKVTSFPSGAQVWVDGVNSGKVTPMSVSLPEGDHTVMVLIPNSGWNPDTRTVTIVEGNNDLSITLLPALTVGPQGPPGPKGDKGDTGAKGDKGDTGDAGQQGEPGADGAPGEPGAPGTPGAAAAVRAATSTECTTGGIVVTSGDGSVSIPVCNGAQGVQGVQGAQGEQGPRGATGPAGPAGSAGTGGPVDPTTIIGYRNNVLVTLDHFLDRNARLGVSPIYFDIPTTEDTVGEVRNYQLIAGPINLAPFSVAAQTPNEITQLLSWVNDVQRSPENRTVKVELLNNFDGEVKLMLDFEHCYPVALRRDFSQTVAVIDCHQVDVNSGAIGDIMVTPGIHPIHSVDGEDVFLKLNELGKAAARYIGGGGELFLPGGTRIEPITVRVGSRNATDESLNPAQIISWVSEVLRGNTLNPRNVGIFIPSPQTGQLTSFASYTEVFLTRIGVLDPMNHLREEVKVNFDLVMRATSRQ